MFDQLFEDLLSKEENHERNKENDDGRLEILRGEVLPSGDSLFRDKHMRWQVERHMNLTSEKQAALFVQAFRQRELDQVRFQQAGSLGLSVALCAADYIERNDGLVKYFEDHRPRSAPKVQLMVEELDACIIHFPTASIRSYLSRYYGG
jgi:hypothetical protein